METGIKTEKWRNALGKVKYIYEVLLGEITFHGVKALTEGWEGGSVNRCLSMHKAFGTCSAQLLHKLGVAHDCTLSTQKAGAGG